MKTFALAASILFLVHNASAQCVAEDESLDACMTTAGTGDVAKEACDVCVTAAAAATSAIATTTCDELAAGDSGLCVALNLCPCPESCAADVDAYALCEVNDELGLGCTNLNCRVDGTDTPPDGTDAPPEGTDTPPDGTDSPPTEAAGSPTDPPAPTEAAGAPTEAPPTAAPTSAAASLTYAKMGSLVVGIIATIYSL
jgi:hypothetical protein